LVGSFGDLGCSGRFDVLIKSVIDRFVAVAFVLAGDPAGQPVELHVLCLQVLLRGPGCRRVLAGRLQDADGGVPVEFAVLGEGGDVLVGDAADLRWRSQDVAALG
jgi:hypothetical protein